jgi:predicted PurR-regulated permease PerM
MSGAAEVLVIVLAVVLAIFLVLAIVLAILMIRITRQIKKITGTAERTVANLENATHNVTKFGSPLLIGRMLAKQFSQIKDRRK